MFAAHKISNDVCRMVKIVPFGSFTILKSAIRYVILTFVMAPKQIILSLKFQSRYLNFHEMHFL